MRKIEINSNKIRRRELTDKITENFFLAITILSASVIALVVILIASKGVTPFIHNYLIDGKYYRANLMKFLFSNTWFNIPNIYGVGFIIINTLYIVFLSILVATPISVLTALFISKIASPKIGVSLTFIIEMLASVPSIVYGLFGIVIITNAVKSIAALFNYQTAGGVSTLASIIVLSIMIMPTITMLSITAINSVRKNIIEGSLALGATPTQTNFKIVLLSAKSGIFAGVILGVGRALGEATAISMVIGNSGTGPTFDLFGISRTLTSTMLLGLKETTGLDYDIRFSVGIVLIIIIILSNLTLNHIKRKIGNIK